MPLIGHLRTTKECFDALTNLYEKKAPAQKMILKKQLCTLKMGKDEPIFAFFSKIAQTRDQLTTIGIVVDDDDLVQLQLMVSLTHGRLFSLRSTEEKFNPTLRDYGMIA
jgi:hypothetical protein